MENEKVNESDKYIHQIYKLKLDLIEKESKIQELTFELDLHKMAYENLMKSSIHINQKLVY